MVPMPGLGAVAGARRAGNGKPLFWLSANGFNDLKEGTTKDGCAN